MTVNLNRSMKARVAVIAVAGLLTLSVFAIGFTAVSETESSATAAASAPAAQPDDSAAISAFKFVCPFH